MAILQGPRSGRRFVNKSVGFPKYCRFRLLANRAQILRNPLIAPAWPSFWDSAPTGDLENIDCNPYYTSHRFPANRAPIVRNAVRKRPVARDLAATADLSKNRRFTLVWWISISRKSESNPPESIPGVVRRVGPRGSS